MAELSDPQGESTPAPAKSFNTKGTLIFAVMVVIALIFLGAKYFPSKHSASLATEVYTLVPDKLSQSAAIAVSLPDDFDMTNFDPVQSVHFSPNIAGDWQAPKEGDRVFKFFPAQKMAVGTYYLAALETPALRLEKMFSIDADPSVLAVFPKNEAEVNEYSKITIMFSRPMVALSTLEETADMDVPVNISPPTEGRWKWITTRTLQFIPTIHLVRSSHYAVNVKTGFVSQDGVAVAPFTHFFTTRTLNYLYQMTSTYTTTLAHGEPIRIPFNQPFDLEQTKTKVTLSSGGAPVQFVAAYGTREVYDAEEDDRHKTLADRSVLEIYPLKDKHGREYLWDFGQTYQMSISGAVPTEGDIVLTAGAGRNVKVEDLIGDYNATSPRSNVVTTDFFDPQGKLVIELSEPIDLARSRISGASMVKVEYGEKCREPEVGEEVDEYSQSCAKVPDQTRLEISFDPAKFALGETGLVTIEKLVNPDGLSLLDTPTTFPLTMYPKFRIISTTPADGATNASLKEIKICSTGPLTEPTEDEFYSKVRANMMIGKWYWSRSFRINTFDPKSPPPCPIHTFYTSISYGLVPNFPYEMTLDLADHFGQTASVALRFSTKDADPLDKNFEHLQDSVLMTPPDRTTLTYALDFMDDIDLTICKVNPESMLKYRVAMPKIIESAVSLACIDKRQKHITLPDSFATRKYFQVDLQDYFPDELGNYVLVFSNPSYYRMTREWNGKEYVDVVGGMLYEKTFVTVTRLSVGAKTVERYDAGDRNGYANQSADRIPPNLMDQRWPKNLYWVNNYRTLLASEGAEVTQYVTGGPQKLLIIKGKTATTDKEGIATIPSAGNVIGAVIKKGEDSAIVMSNDRLSYAEQAAPTRREYVYTDRPIYRPGDTVHVKGIARIGYDAKYEGVEGTSTLELRDSRYEVARKDAIHYGKNGTFETSFVLDTKARLGYYQLNTGGGGYGSFQVEEYVAPDFKVNISADKDEYISGDTAKLNISADYYFGVPVEGADASYRVVSQDFYFDRYQDDYFSFGSSWYHRDGGYYGDKFLFSGNITLGKDGKGSVAKEFSIDRLFSGDYKKQSKLITVFVTVKNQNGQSVSSSKSFILHRGEYYAGVITDDYYYRSGQSGALKLKTVDTTGKPASQKDLAVVLERVEWRRYKRQEVDGNFYYRSEEVRTPVGTWEVDTDDNGNGSVPFTAPLAGEYLFSVKGADRRENAISAEYAFYVSGTGAVSVRPTNNATLELASDKTDLSTGQTASLVIKSPFPRAKALITIARGDIYKRDVVELTSQITRYQFPVTEQMIPSVTADALVIAPDPEVKYGSIQFSVDSKDKKLDINIVPSKKTYLPGEEVLLDVVVKDASGKPVQAELSLAAVNESVLALVGNPKKEPVSFFYGYQPMVITTSANLKNVLHVAEIPVGTKGGSGDGGNDLEKKKRGEFKDTAYWNGTIETDMNGRASVRFTLPDNLTEWQVEGVGVTGDTKLGVGYENFVTRKTLMAVPLRPRFVLPGDNFAVGGTLFNESDVPQKLEVSVVSPALVFTGDTKTTIVVDPHSNFSVSFPASAPESIIEGAHSFTLSAKNDKYEDVVDSTFPIERNNTYEFTVTAGRVEDPSVTERVYLPANIVPDRGMLDISVAATMATMLDTAVRGMMIYPYECSEQVSSKLRTIALVKQYSTMFSTDTPMLPKTVTMGAAVYTIDQIVERGLAKLYANQRGSGGVAYYPSMQEDKWLTMQVLETYLDLKQAGYAVDQSKISAAAQYVSNWINHSPEGMSMMNVGYTQTAYQQFTYQEPVSDEIFIRGAYIISRVGNSALFTPPMSARHSALAKDRDKVSRGLSSSALAYLTVLASNGQAGKLTNSVTNHMFAEFENRSVIDARGATVRRGVESSPYLENDIQNTALALKAFSASRHDTALLEGYMRALRSSKARDGGWASTYNSLTVIDAVLEYLRYKNEANAHLSLKVAADGAELLTATFDKSNALNTFTTSVPVASLKKGASQSITFNKTDLGLGKSAYYYDMLLKYFLPAASIAPRDEGFSVERAFYASDDIKFERPLTEAKQGDVLHARLVIRTPSLRSHVSIEDFIPAGVEIVNQNFATEDKTLGGGGGYNDYNDGDGGYRYRGAAPSSIRGKLAAVLGSSGEGPNVDTDGVVTDEMYAGKNTTVSRLYPSAVENHDDRMFAYTYSLPQGEYEFDYYVRALVPGTYQHLPAVVSELYTPENFGRTAGATFTVLPKD